MSFWERAMAFADTMMRPWNAYQIAIALGVFAAAWVAGRIIGPRMQDWMRSREGWPKWRMRIFVVLHRRLGLILFVGMIWALVWIMRMTTWPSRSYLLAVIAQLAFAYLVIAVLTRLISNKLLRSAVRYVGWVWVTLSILGLSDQAQAILDSASVHLGEMRLSLWILLQAGVILGALFALARFISVNSATRVRRNDDISPSMQVLVIKFMQVLLYGAAVFIGLRTIGVDLTGLAVLSGAIGVGLGFGLQKVVSNLVSGIIILLDKSIKPGDVISLGETFGWINALGARYVSVVTRDGKEYLIPNEDLITGQVVNWSHSDDFVRLDIFFGTAYEDDPHLVRKIAIEAAQSVDRVLKTKPSVCHVVGFGDSSVDYILRFWIRDPTGGLTNIRGNVYLALWDAFKEHGISIPFPQREVRMLGEAAARGDGALPSDAGKGASTSGKAALD
ncbi:mechanosensitive ion channel protein [Rhodobacterales bacterium 59_46_T64]|nr:mechanosensitive ion channel protein [Rhodobacterales bacterium 59_46_T64]